MSLLAGHQCDKVQTWQAKFQQHTHKHQDVKIRKKFFQRLSSGCSQFLTLVKVSFARTEQSEYGSFQLLRRAHLVQTLMASLLGESIEISSLASPPPYPSDSSCSTSPRSSLCSASDRFRHVIEIANNREPLSEIVALGQPGHTWVAADAPRSIRE